MASHLVYLMRRQFDRKGVAKRLKDARENKPGKPSITKLARIAGVHRNTYADWESAESHKLPSDVEVIEKICDFLQISPTYLISGNTDWSMDVAPQHKDRMQKFYNRFRSETDFNLLMRTALDMDIELIEPLAKFMLTFQVKSNSADSQ